MLFEKMYRSTRKRISSLLTEIKTEIPVMLIDTKVSHASDGCITETCRLYELVRKKRGLLGRRQHVWKYSYA